MDFLLTRYRNLTVLLIVIVSQLVLIAYQVKTNRDVPLIRVWAVTAVTPVEQGLEFLRRNSIGRVEDYFYLLGVQSENQRLKKELGELKLQNNYLQNELSTADRARALSVFQLRSPSKTLAARIIGNGTGANSKVVFVDRGSASAVEAGMAVITPDGIVGKVLDAYPTASLVMLLTDPTFAAGVISQKSRVRGTLKGQGNSTPTVDYVQNEQKVDPGEWFFTSGDDRIFPKGFPVGKADVVRNGKNFKEIYLTPSAFQGAPEEVLIVLEGVHQAIPDTEIASPGYKLLAPPSDAGSDKGEAGDTAASVLSTDADRLKEQYKQAGQAQNHVFGEGLPGSKPPDFTKIGAKPAQTAQGQPKPGGATGSVPAQPPGAVVKPTTPATPVAGSPPKPAVNTPGAPSTNTAAKPPAAGTTGVTKPPVAKTPGSIAEGTEGAASESQQPPANRPVLVTDPNDADPELAPPARAKPERPVSSPKEPPKDVPLDEFGQPKAPVQAKPKLPAPAVEPGQGGAPKANKPKPQQNSATPPPPKPAP